MQNTKAILVFFITGFISLFLIYRTNIKPIWVAVKFKAAVNLESTNPMAASTLFSKVLDEASAAEQSQFVPYFEDFAVRFAQNSQDPQSKDLAAKNLDRAIELLQRAAKGTDNEPALWYELSNVYVAKARLTGQPLNVEAEMAAEKAVSLAPKRVEPKYFLAQVKLTQKKYAEAIKISQQIVLLAPSLSEAQWRLAETYFAAGDNKNALAAAARALDGGFHPQSGDVLWVNKLYGQPEFFAEAGKILGRVSLN